MALFLTFTTIAAIIVFGAMLRRPAPDRAWRDQAEGLRERLEHEGLPRG
jgi:hypothetical protein